MSCQKTERKRKQFSKHPFFLILWSTCCPKWCQTDWQQVVSKKMQLLFSPRLLVPSQSPWPRIVQWEKSIVPTVSMTRRCAFLLQVYSSGTSLLNRFQCQYGLLPTNVKKWPQRAGSDAVSGCWQCWDLLAAHPSGNIFRNWAGLDEKDTISTSWSFLIITRIDIYIYKRKRLKMYSVA